jgi:hypothetical protein
VKLIATLASKHHYGEWYRASKKKKDNPNKTKIADPINIPYLFCLDALLCTELVGLP